MEPPNRLPSLLRTLVPVIVSDHTTQLPLLSKMFLLESAHSYKDNPIMVLHENLNPHRVEVCRIVVLGFMGLATGFCLVSMTWLMLSL
jgi:hypothetical protein